MKNQFEEVMTKRTNAELVAVLNSAEGDYVPQAMEAAKAEFDRRNLTNEQIEVAELQVEEKRQFGEAKANEPLSSNMKILTFIFPGIFALMYSGIYKGGGYDRKAKELVKYTLYGFGTYVTIAILLQFFN